MVATPLQSMLQIDALSRDTRTLVESLLVLFALLGAFAVRRRKRAVTATTFLLLSGSALIDAGARFIPNEQVGQKVAVAAFVLFLFGLIRLVLEFVDAVSRRGKVHFSSIGKELLMLVLWFVVVMVVLYTDFGVQPLSILTTTTVFAAVLGFALQETLGNVFSGLSLSIGRPFDPGDWIRSGTHVGQVKGIAWRATTIVTRDGERLEVPNSVIAKDVLFNYTTGHVREEITVGISYGVPPNHVREVVLTLLRDVPGVLREPPPEVLVWSYGDFAIQYLIKYWIGDYGVQEHVRDRVASSLWYALRRHSIEIPFPTRTVHVRDAGRDEDERADAQFERELMSDLRQVDWLRGLSDDELRLLVPTVAVRQFGAGEMLVRAGEAGESMFIVRSGKAEVFGHTADGQVRHIAEIGPGVITGEMALMTGEPRNANVRALTDLEVIEMDREGLTRLFKEHPDAVASIGDIITARNRERLEKLASGDTLDGKGGPHRWLLNKMRELFDF
ncbi:MAG TPA: cyclic nucleotide-binding domain-containing protein [Candidatus Binatus sp.]|uniref:cyclic nucleotide-binding domain-containing protein n=1 Tax=Candidatus Binatus sp. TaxID=2811406 RepID=UPI002B4A0901|nr:cyclic nucleotide-binding domain-containing protein [Candidatus Binatus sp.]HKN14363.1 cyclic nucleotide-binding domain-containing protein [Candidatus Binatus sp.]